LAATGGKGGEGGGVGDGDGEGEENGVAIVLPGVVERIVADSSAEKLRMPNFKKIDVLKQGQRPSGAAAGEAGEVEGRVAGEGEAPVDEANRFPAVEDVVGAKITVN